MEFTDVQAVMRAAHFAAVRHSAQRRKGADAEPYINHLIEVADLVARFNPNTNDVNLVIAALLHDTIEDVNVTVEELRESFGDDVAALVLELTDNKSLPKEKRKALQVELAPKKSRRAQILSTADKLANTRSILAKPPLGWSLERRREYFEWARRVVSRFPDVPEDLRREFEATISRAP